MVSGRAANRQGDAGGRRRALRAFRPRGGGTGADTVERDPASHGSRGGEQSAAGYLGHSELLSLSQAGHRDGWIDKLWWNTFRGSYCAFTRCSRG
jgi:hypothetical protein